MAMEAPGDLLNRLKLGREEYCQRLLTMLILNGSYPRWNTASKPSPDGQRFLDLLEKLSFGHVGQWSEPEFIDELDLPRRSDLEQGGAPDLALRDARRVWMIELKTEAGSHRPGQIPGYFELGAHHYPSHTIDITYLTGRMSKPAPPVPDGSGFAHVTWEAVLPLIHGIWSGDSGPEADAVDMLHSVLGDTTTPWTEWRASRLHTAGTPSPNPTRDAERLARETSRDRAQRALDVTAESLEQLQELRMSVQQMLVASDEPELAHVRPWLWRWQSGGRPMTASGQESGYELRLSWYSTPLPGASS